MMRHLLQFLVFVAVMHFAPAADLAFNRDIRPILSENCFNCHGPKLEGGQGPSLVDSYWQHGSSPAAILHVIDKGVPGSPMIPYEAVFPEADRLAFWSGNFERVFERVLDR